MPLLTSQPISALAVELLRRSLVLVGTVSRVPVGEYQGPSGGTVTLRVPVPRTAREQAVPGADITYDPADETAVDVALSHWYNGVLVTDEDLSLTIESFGRQLLMPSVQAIAEAGENQLVGVMNALATDVTIEWAAAADPAADDATLLAIRERLTTNLCPAGNRYVAVAPDIATRLLSVEKFVLANQRGDGGTALEQATIGTVYGLKVIESAAIGAGSAVAYHASGFAFGNAAPAPAGGGADSTTASEGGVSLRHVLAFDPGKLSTASVVSTFAGAAVVPEDDAGTVIKRAFRVGTAA
jgi:hypothetical protein